MYFLLIKYSKPAISNPNLKWLQDQDLTVILLLTNVIFIISIILIVFYERKTVRYYQNQIAQLEDKSRRTVLVKKRKRCAQDNAHLILSESNQRLLQMSIALSFEKLIPMEGGELQEAVKPKEIEKLLIPNSISMLLNDLVTSQKELRPQSMYEIHDSINKILRWFLPLDHESTLYLVAPKKSFLSW